MDNIDTSWVSLQIDSLLKKKVGDLFHTRTQKEFQREEIYALLRASVRESLDIYQQNFSLGIQKALAEARFKTTFLDTL